MPTIALVTRLTDPRKLHSIRQTAPDAELLHFHDDRDALATRGTASEIVYGNVRPHEFGTLRRLRWVHANWAGVENLLYPEMLESPVIVTNTRGQCAVSMSEHILAGLLYWSRDLPAHLEADRAGQWRRQTDARHLRGTRALVLGAGSIAQVLIPMLNTLGVEVLAVNTDGRPIEGAVATIKLADLTTCSPASGSADHLIVLLPGTPHTRHVVNDALFASLNDGATLVNVSRGSVVDEAAMLRAIDTGRLRGAVLDVTDPEPPPPESPLFSHPRVLLTGHRSWQPPNEDNASFDVFLHNLRCYVEGRLDDMRNVVDKRMGY